MVSNSPNFCGSFVMSKSSQKNLSQYPDFYSKQLVKGVNKSVKNTKQFAEKSLPSGDTLELTISPPVLNFALNREQAGTLKYVSSAKSVEEKLFNLPIPKFTKGNFVEAVESSLDNLSKGLNLKK